MLKKPEKRTTALTLGNKDYCNIDVEGSKTLTAACIELQKCMNKITRWQQPSLQIFFKSGNDACGVMTIEDSLFVVYIENKEQKIEKIDGTLFGLSQNADIEELIFIITRQFIKNIRENSDEWVENMLMPRNNYPKEELTTEKETFKQAMLRIIDTLEKAEREAEKQYRIPEFTKGQMLLLEHCRQI